MMQIVHATADLVYLATPRGVAVVDVSNRVVPWLVRYQAPVREIDTQDARYVVEGNRLLIMAEGIVRGVVVVEDA